jgi:alkaline phosphatase
MVEGSHIDHAAHANNSQDLMFEMEEFDKCVNAAFDYADTHKGTLVVVTADHETGGVSLLSNNKDYTQGESGIDIKFATTGHSGAPVMVYAYGASAWKFSGVMENTDLFKKMKELLIDGKK